MPGFLAPIWETVFKLATWSALIFGSFSILSAFVSAWVGWQITDATQKDADTRIKAADVRIAEATTRAAEANQKAEEEKLARVKIEERIAWRKLDAGQANQVLSVAKQYSGQEYALTVSADPEAMNLMEIVDQILQTAGWVRVKPFGQVTTFGEKASVGMKTGPLGFHIAVSKGDLNLKDVAIRMAEIFEAVGIKSKPATDPEIEQRPTAIAVVIASKPF